LLLWSGNANDLRGRENKKDEHVPVWARIEFARSVCRFDAQYRPILRVRSWPCIAYQRELA
jgi:hypothetical protein